MQAIFDPAARKGRLSLSISQHLLDRLEPYKHQINISAQAELLLEQLLEKLENRSWAERNAQALTEHGRAIMANGLAGEEFERI
ncbi:MAG: type II toxin-antitoxin system CcdA family antitoxin [Rhodocyclales bacterium]|nr:type II toxin-antitoxin system CcdA family antitoxin [Rhodocyclales bacterium]